MAEYYPLLSKAVSALDMDATEARHAIYARARTALKGQLRSVMPPLAETHIESESRALDLAIARIEAEIAIRSAIRGGAARPPAPPASVAAPPLTGFEPAAGEPPPPRAPLPPVLRPLPPAAPRVPPASGFIPRAPTAPIVMAAPTISKIAEAEASPVSPSEAGPEATPAARAQPRRPSDGKNGGHPVAPLKPEKKPRNLRGLIVALAIFVVVGAVAGAAYMLKQSQDDLARIARPAPVAGEPADTPVQPGKIIERVGGAPNLPGQASAPVSPSGPDTAISPVKVTTTTVRPAPQTAPANAIPESVAAPQPAVPGIAVAHRAAILVEAPEESSKVKTYAGTVIWRVEQVKKEGKPPATVLRAEIDIPAAKTQAAITLQRNLDTSLPASHVMELHFTTVAGGDIPGIKEVRMPEMRAEDNPAGEALMGLLVPVIENFFIVGLAKGDTDAAHNLELLVARNWIDIPLTLSNQKRAKITFEKGVAGERALNEALAAWK